MTQAEEHRYQQALAFAAEKHRGQTRIGGLAYITHPVAVAEIIQQQGYGIDYRITALFHDLLEDTDATRTEIEQIGGAQVLRAVVLLTKTENYVMSEYVAGIRSNPIAFAVKAADRLHNLRCALCTDDEFKRRYVLETIDWYLDFSDQIPNAVKALARSMKTPIRDLPLEYQPIESFLCQQQSGQAQSPICQAAF